MWTLISIEHERGLGFQFCWLDGNKKRFCWFLGNDYYRFLPFYMEYVSCLKI